VADVLATLNYFFKQDKLDVITPIFSRDHFSESRRRSLRSKESPIRLSSTSIRMRLAPFLTGTSTSPSQRRFLKVTALASGEWPLEDMTEQMFIKADPCFKHQHWTNAGVLPRAGGTRLDKSRPPDSSPLPLFYVSVS
jgi:hypothetical protein